MVKFSVFLSACSLLVEPDPFKKAHIHTTWEESFGRALYFSVESQIAPLLAPNLTEMKKNIVIAADGIYDIFDGLATIHQSISQSSSDG